MEQKDDEFLKTFKPNSLLKELKDFCVDTFLDQPDSIDLEINPGVDCFEVFYTLKWTNTDDMLHGEELEKLAQFCKERDVSYLLKMDGDFSSEDDDRWIEINISLVSEKLE
jgi:hypothetical protein